MCFCGFHVQLIALFSQANTHGALLVSGLQEEQVYFIFSDAPPQLTLQFYLQGQ